MKFSKHIVHTVIIQLTQLHITGEKDTNTQCWEGSPDMDYPQSLNYFPVGNLPPVTFLASQSRIAILLHSGL